MGETEEEEGQVKAFYCDWCGKKAAGVPKKIVELAHAKLCEACHRRHYQPEPVKKRTGRDRKYNNWGQGFGPQDYKPVTRDPEETYG